MNQRGLAFGWIVVSTALAVACGSDSDSDLGKKNTGGSGGNTGGSGGNTGGSGGGNTGGSNTGGSSTGGSAGTSTGGTAGSSSGGSAGSATGGTAGSSTGGAAGSSSGGSAGGGGTKPDGGVKSCSQLASEYAATLEAAKACNPVLSVLQCTQQVNDELPCPCPTFINPANAKAVAELDDLQAAWNAQNCGSGVICPAVLCVAPTSGVCQANGSLAGKCANSVPN
jgi:hypothetical protein